MVEVGASAIRRALPQCVVTGAPSNGASIACDERTLGPTHIHASAHTRAHGSPLGEQRTAAAGAPDAAPSRWHRPHAGAARVQALHGWVRPCTAVLRRGAPHPRTAATCQPHCARTRGGGVHGVRVRACVRVPPPRADDARPRRAQRDGSKDCFIVYCAHPSLARTHESTLWSFTRAPCRSACRRMAGGWQQCVGECAYAVVARCVHNTYRANGAGAHAVCSNSVIACC
jgi:hypothetical protein